MPHTTKGYGPPYEITEDNHWMLDEKGYPKEEEINFEYGDKETTDLAVLFDFHKLPEEHKLTRW